MTGSNPSRIREAQFKIFPTFPYIYDTEIIAWNSFDLVSILVRGTSTGPRLLIRVWVPIMWSQGPSFPVLDLSRQTLVSYSPKLTCSYFAAFSFQFFCMFSHLQILNYLCLIISVVSCLLTWHHLAYNGRVGLCCYCLRSSFLHTGSQL